MREYASQGVAKSDKAVTARSWGSDDRKEGKGARSICTASLTTMRQHTMDFRSSPTPLPLSAGARVMLAAAKQPPDVVPVGESHRQLLQMLYISQEREESSESKCRQSTMQSGLCWCTPQMPWMLHTQGNKSVLRMHFEALMRNSRT